MKVKDLDNTVAALRNTELKNFGAIFARNLVRAENLRYMHLHLVYPRIMESRQTKIMTQIFKDRTVENAIQGGRFTPEFLGELDRRMTQESEDAIATHLAREADDYLARLASKDPQFGPWLRALEHSAVMALWSAFESLASDIWIYAVNLKPNLFAQKVMRQFNESLQRQGLSSRSIPVGIAARYNFDLRNHIGDIVAESVDFTSLSDITKAYKAAFSLNTDGQKRIECESLKKLVLMRNLIAHRSGVVDREFKEKSGLAGNIGDELVVAEGLAGELMDGATEAGTYLISVVDQSLLGNQTS